MALDFIHLHVHTQYSLLDGQASIPKLVDKAIKDGMKGMAITDHGNMMGIKEYYNYINKKKSNAKDDLVAAQEQLAKEDLSEEERKEAETKLAKAQLTLDFKPIFGCEMYVAPRDLTLKDKAEGDNANYHLIVLAKNEVGYHNLIKLVSKAWTDGYYFHPRTDHKELEKHHEGLIVCSACLAGEIARNITKNDISKAEETALWYKNLFGDDYYLELQLHKATVERANHECYPLQLEVNKNLKEMSKKLGIKLICSNDVHFVDEENAEAHDRLICLSTGKDVDDPTRMFYSKQEWFKTREEMQEIFGDIPEAMTNTMEILDKIELYCIDHPPIMPNFQIPEEFGTEEEYKKKYTEEDLFNEFTQDEKGNVVMSKEEADKKIKKLGGYQKLYRIKLEADYLRKLAFDGAKEVYPNMTPEIEDQLNFELHIMKTMGFPGYFLIVQDFINAARKELGVWVGPGRGSAAGSAVAYCLGITKIDPIKYDLLFERFLNPDRISLPDIDVDFDDEGRGKVLQWVTEKYGKEKVAHIITYGTMATKMAIKDVARVQKVPLATSNAWCKAIPDHLPEVNGKEPKMNLTNAIAGVPELFEASRSEDPIISDTIKYAQMLEGNVRGTGVHACGVIICRDDITDWVPVSTADDKETNEKLVVTQYEGKVIEETGLIKMDFLGLKTLSILKDAVFNVKESLDIDVDIDNIPIDDELTYKLYSEGKTIGTFQFESPGMQKYLRELQPSTFEDLIAMNALYRPGPMDYIPDFIDRKLGKKPIEYDIPVMEKYLKDSYGITVYQEQVMLLSRLLANFTRGESDTLRKAMGKKLKDKLDHLKPKFIAGGKSNGHDEKVLEKIWTDWEKFASYAFNKSHATCYSWVAFQTGYMKAHYPAQYMAAVMSNNVTDIKEITKLMTECKKMGINTLGPDVNESYVRFSANKDGDVRYGLEAVRGIGTNAAEIIVKERKEKGPFTSIYDFAERIPQNICNRKVYESLVNSGAFDCFDTLKREQYMLLNNDAIPFLESLMNYGARVQEEKMMAQTSLFGDDEAAAIKKPTVPANNIEWNQIEKLKMERDYIGIYLSAHPLDDYAVVLRKCCNVKCGDLNDIEGLYKQKVTTLRFGGIVTGVSEKISKQGKPFGIVKLEDYSDEKELMIFDRDWITYKNYFTIDAALYIVAKLETSRFNPDGRVYTHYESIQFLSDAKKDLVNNIELTGSLDNYDDKFCAWLNDYCNNNPGDTTLNLTIIDKQLHGKIFTKASKKINVLPEFLDEVEADDLFQVNIS